MQARRVGGLDLPLVAIIGALLLYLFFIPADFSFKSSPSKSATKSAPPQISPQDTIQQCPECPAAKECPIAAPATAPRENPFCRKAMDRCNRVSLPDETLCSILDEILAEKQPTDLCFTPASIPHIIHQSWKHAGLPENFARWSQSWKDHHPDWEYKFWSDEDNDNFVAKNYGWVFDTYMKFPGVINRADMVRYLYMHKEGGVYADMDTWLIRKLDTLTEGMTTCVGQKAILAMMSDDADFEHNIPNAWMASSPGHPFWIFLVRVIQERHTHIYEKEAEGDDSAAVGVEKLTGPIVLKEAYDTWMCAFGYEQARIQLIDPGFVFVSNWNNKEESDYFIKMCDGSTIASEQNQKKCLKAFPDAHVLTFWSHSWHDPLYDKHKNDEEQEDKKEEEEGKTGGKKDKDYSYDDEGDYQ